MQFWGQFTAKSISNPKVKKIIIAFFITELRRYFGIFISWKEQSSHRFISPKVQKIISDQTEQKSKLLLTFLWPPIGGWWINECLFILSYECYFYEWETWIVKMITKGIRMKVQWIRSTYRNTFCHDCIMPS